jgi:gephyrin
MSSPTLKAAILVISTTASKDPSADSSGGILKDVFDNEGAGKWEVTSTKIVGDDVLDIQRSITSWTDQGNPVNVIITTGGTGFAVLDSTPEVRDILTGGLFGNVLILSGGNSPFT